jgi:hypothetical protein
VQRLALVVDIGFLPIERRDGADFSVADAELAGVVEGGMDVNG